MYPQINHRQLFDLRRDPSEKHDLADNPKYAGEIERLKILMAEWQTRVGDKQPLTVANPKPKELNLDGYIRKPDQWQPRWIVEKYF